MRARSRVFACLLLGARALSAAEPDVRVAPEPAWVEPLDLPEGATPPADVRSGIYTLVVDRQVRVGAPTLERYYRRAYKVLSTAGVQEARESKVVFDPDYQKLVFHEFRLWRDGRNVRTFSRADVSVVHEEADLQQRLYNGKVSAIVFLKDVRPGDVVDYSYSLLGANPIFEGRFSGTFDLAYTFPVARLRNRLFWPSRRPLLMKTHRTDLEPQVRESGGQKIYLWERADVQAVRSEDATPGWFDPQPSVDVGEFSSWNDVARWASQLFARSATTSPRLRALVRELETEPGETARAARAIRFVQDEVRYLGIEMGPNSHKPHPPEWVLEQRYGDCKDKALLLVSLLRALGIAADAALVNTSTGRALDERLPSPFAFDHAIVMATIGGTPVWIDATLSETGGSPEATEPPPFERALLVRDDSSALIPIPVPVRAAPTVVVEESYRLSAPGQPSQLVVKTTYRGRDADERRQSLARTSATDLASAYLNHYAREDSSVRALARPTARDDRERNVLVEEERYELPSFWKEGRHDFYAWAVGDQLRRPATALRSMPVEVGYPVHVEHKLVIELPEPLELDAHRRTIASSGFSLGSRSDVVGKKVTLTYDYRSLDSSVAPPDAQRHFEALDQASRALNYRVDLAWRQPGIHGRDEPASAWLAFGVLAVTVAGLGGVGWRVLRRRGRKQTFPATHALPSGDSPAHPLRTPPDDVATHLAGRACTCGARGRIAETERHAVTYDDRPMQVLTCHCAVCGTEHAIYVVEG